MNSITDMLTKDASLSPAATGGFVTGRVVENGDSQFPGMVRVAFTAWAEGENITKWLPVLSPYAGKEHGRYFIPEVDDIVLVGFIGPMLEQPFVLGSFFPADSTLPGAQTDKKNLGRMLKTKGGVMLSIRDEEGKQSARAETPKGLSVSVEDEGETLTLSDKGGKNLLKLDCKAGSAEITADKTVTLKAGQCEITLDGSGGAITIKAGKISIEGSQSFSAKSNSLLSLEGGMTTVEGKQTVTLKGSALCEISGGMVKIN